MKVAYLIPEWPGQSHVWAWREVCHLREMQLDVELFSTRLPPPQVMGHHAFVAEAIAQTTYLWPLSPMQLLQTVLWALGRNLLGFLACIWLGLTLPVSQQPAWKTVLPLVLPACRLAQQAQMQQIEHIHTPMAASTAILGMMVKRLLGIPFSLTLVADFDHWGGAMAEKFTDAAFVAVVGDWMQRQLQQEYPMVSPERCAIARHGVDTQIWQPDGNQRQRYPTHCKQLISVGRLERNKGFQELLQAMALVKAKDIPFHLRIAGEGSYRPVLEDLIQNLNLAAEVTLLGSISEEACRLEMQSADLFVLASHKEALGVVYLEAMACGIATVGTQAGGVLEIIQSGVDGCLVPPQDPAALALALTELLSDDAQRERLAKAGYYRVRNQFDSRIGAKTLHDLLIRSHTSPPTVAITMMPNCGSLGEGVGG
jgi:colanic acid/amylovoran biosynthesis glycosyltransferase